MDKKLEAMKALFALFSLNFVEAFKGSALDKELKETDKMKIFKLIGQSFEQTINDMLDEYNKRKVEGDRKDA